VGAVGSLKEDLVPLDIVLPDQFLDRTRGRISTFFGGGVVAHIAFGDPVCPDLLGQVHRASHKAGIPSKKGGTYVCMEGPAFSTKAESNLYRNWGMDVIGMTNLQEAKLAREAEICYVTIALVTDFDCWHETHETVSADMIISNLQKNCQAAQSIIAQTVKDLQEKRDCTCGDALKYPDHRQNLISRGEKQASSLWGPPELSKRGKDIDLFGQTERNIEVKAKADFYQCLSVKYTGFLLRLPIP
jgi:5'-methylthioadenosine phosphorylase